MDFSLTNESQNVKLLLMKSPLKKIMSGLLPIPFFFVMTFCCCLQTDARASLEHVSRTHNRDLGKSHHHHANKNQHRHDHECSCPKHFSFLSEPPFDITPDLSSSQLLAKDVSAVPAFEVVLLSFSSLHSQGPPGQDHRDQVATPIFLKNSNLRI